MPLWLRLRKCYASRVNVPRPFDTPRPLRLTVDDFDALHRAGTLARHKRLELIDGAIVSMNAEYRRHSFAKNELTFLLRLALARLGSDYLPMSEPTLAVPPYNAPEPDIVVTNDPVGEGYVPIDSVAIVIEISDTTLRYDLGDKLALYANAGVPEYWVVDCRDQVIHQFWSPAGAGYAETRVLPVAGKISSVTIRDLEIDGTGIF